MIKGYSKNKTISKAYAGDISMAPTLSLSSNDLKDIKNWKVGETYDLDLTVKQKSMHLNSDGSVDATFDVQDVTAEDDAADAEANDNGDN